MSTIPQKCMHGVNLSGRKYVERMDAAKKGE